MGNNISYSITIITRYLTSSNKFDFIHWSEIYRWLHMIHMLHVNLSAGLKKQPFLRSFTGIWLRTHRLVHVGSWSVKILLNYLYISLWKSYPLNRQERTACCFQMICSCQSFTVGAMTIQFTLTHWNLSHYINCLHPCTSPFCNSNGTIYYAWPILLALVLWPAVIWTNILGSGTRWSSGCHVWYNLWCPDSSQTRWSCDALLSAAVLFLIIQGVTAPSDLKSEHLDYIEYWNMDLW